MFTEAVWNYYYEQGRHDLPWRQPLEDGSFDPYRIMVSELMLQQTQVNRVIEKYGQFLEVFPTVDALALAELGNVLKVWVGLGYNRRAKFLHQASKTVVNDREGIFPITVGDLVRLPGVGPNTAGAIAAYAYNQPTVFIETNIRTVYIHHFFADGEGISDAAIGQLVTDTLDHEHPREWYWALMDYGSHLKRTTGNASRRSASYNRQSVFQGSRRQIRGQVIKILSDGPSTGMALAETISDERLSAVLADLASEGIIQQAGETYRL